jgi:hypothetical protein
MFIRPRVLAIFVTRRCTAQCDHCGIGAGPRAVGTLSVRRIHDLLAEARDVPTIRRIVFTGGEPFLLGRELDRLIAVAHGYGFATRVITNGYWATNPRAAVARTRSLKAAGLDEIMLSTGSFHEAFVPARRVVAAARALTEAGIPTRVAIEDCDQSRFDDGALKRELGAALENGLLAIARDPWITDAGGRGSAKISHERRRAAQGIDIDGGCSSMMTTISVTPDQMLMACCGFPLEQLPGLRIGSIADRALSDVLRDAPDDGLKMFLHVAGPSGIADFVSRYDPGYALPGNPISICEACTALQRDARAMRIAAKNFPDVAQSVTARFVALQNSFELPPPLNFPPSR